MIFYKRADIVSLAGISLSKANLVITTLRNELTAKGYLNPNHGGIQVDYFCERFNLTEKECAAALKSREKVFYGVGEVSAILNICEANAYRVIRKLTNELQDQDFLIIKRGAIQRHYFCKRHRLKISDCETLLRSQIKYKKEAV